MALADFVDQLNAPGASPFSALTSSSFPSLADFNASTTSEAQVDRLYQRVLLIHSMDNRLFRLSSMLMDLAVPYDYGELAVICVVNWTEHEQDCTIRINYYNADCFITAFDVLEKVRYRCGTCNTLRFFNDHVVVMESSHLVEKVRTYRVKRQSK